jgi:anti-sigma regulatory factor (Ser/Thr protein kinase)
VRVRRPAPDRPSQAPLPNPPGNLKALELVGGLLRIGRDLETVLEALELRQ